MNYAPWVLWTANWVHCLKGVSSRLHIFQSWRDSTQKYELFYVKRLYNSKELKNGPREGRMFGSNSQVGDYKDDSQKGGIKVEDGEISGAEGAKSALKHFKHEDNTDVYPVRRKDEKLDSVPKLPSREFKPKKSLGQNFITDLNIIKKICNSLRNNESTGDGSQVVELGCGLGSLTKILFQKYPKMTGIEIDKRAVVELSYRLPELNLINEDILQVNYKELSQKVNQRLWVIGNLPFYITSQILLCFLDFKKFIDRLVITCQLEVANSVFGRKGANQEDNNILRILYKIFTNHKIIFKIPKQVFYPSPKVDAALVYIDFNKKFSFQNNNNCNSNNKDSNNNNINNKDNNNNNINNNNNNYNTNINNINNNENNNKEDVNDEEIIKYNILKYLLKYSFNQRRKKLKNSLSNLLEHLGTDLPDDLWDKRAQNLSPNDYVYLTNYVYQHLNLNSLNELIFNKTSDDLILNRSGDNLKFEKEVKVDIGAQTIQNYGNSQDNKKKVVDRIWRKNKHGPGIDVEDLI